MKRLAWISVLLLMPFVSIQAYEANVEHRNKTLTCENQEDFWEWWGEYLEPHKRPDKSPLEIATRYGQALVKDGYNNQEVADGVLNDPTSNISEIMEANRMMDDGIQKVADARGFSVHVRAYMACVNKRVDEAIKASKRKSPG